uniref:C-type lectin domain-containing protein n=1 Tax=Romanomermis culicivorax TaxID=13658 RepID=A0A915KR13_ROMCU
MDELLNGRPDYKAQELIIEDPILHKYYITKLPNFSVLGTLDDERLKCQKGAVKVFNRFGLTGLQYPIFIGYVRDEDKWLDKSTSYINESTDKSWIRSNVSSGGVAQVQNTIRQPFDFCAENDGTLYDGNFTCLFLYHGESTSFAVARAECQALNKTFSTDETATIDIAKVFRNISQVQE